VTELFSQLESERTQLIRRVFIQLCSPKLNDMGTNPPGEFSFRALPSGGGEHHGDNIRFISHKIETVEAQEHYHREERDSLVAVTVRMILHYAVSVSCCQARKIRTSFVRPFVPRSSKGRFQEPFVAKAWQAAVFSNLIQVYCVNDDALNPPWFGRLHLLLRQLTECVAVTFRSASGDGERFLRFGIIRCEKNPVFGFDSQKPVARCHSKAISHVLGKSRANGPADSANSDFFYHMPCFVEATQSITYVLLMKQLCLAGK
jgi:hypothetical protein